MIRIIIYIFLVWSIAIIRLLQGGANDFLGLNFSASVFSSVDKFARFFFGGGQICRVSLG